MDKVISRKFILSLITLFSTSALAYLSKIDAGTYSAVTIATVGAYLTSNVIQKKIV